MGKILGIDLGTTNSAMAVLEGGEPTIIVNAEGDRTTPSVVGFRADGDRIVGKAAKNQAVTNPTNTVFSIKRFMGRRYDEVTSELKTIPYKVKAGTGSRGVVEIEGEDFTPEQISAMILSKMKADAEKYLGETVTDAVITVPAYFNDAQRQATKDAGKIAGLNVQRIVNEPTAAALAYGLDKTNIDQKVLVFDLGGGTFDVSLLDLADGVVEVLATNGDNHLGGDDWDQRVIDWLADKFQKENGIDLRKDPMALQRLKEAAENAKKELSSAQQAQINLPFITADASGPKHLNYTLTRSEFERITRDLLDRCKAPVTKALRDANLQISQVNEVILVGGSSRMYEAVLGATVDVPTPDGTEVRLKVPAGTQDGKTFRFRDLGAPNVKRKDARGALYVTVRVKVPTMLSKKERDALEALRGADARTYREGFEPHEA